ncbi:glycosyltransferase family 2 protein [Streptosporangium sandarakinum]|uniref:glycosyltransferase family 2 protein n=1 Tax=Streptosporangium sandarakinum TaxID=1260955 RepID=UPI0034252C4A
MISVVVLAYNVGEYLAECLRSVTCQRLVDLEVIAIDNGSPDACGTIIDGFAAADPRVIPLHLDTSVDMGEARNAGLAQAKGDYILFLDGDDALAEPSSLLTISRAIDRYARPDVLFYDFFYRRHCDLRRTSNLTRVLHHQAGPFRLRDRPQAIRVSWSSCNKAYRRAFVESTGLRFPPGYYEDSVWSCRCLLSATTIATLDTVCMNYRCCRRESVSRRPSARHTEVFDQYDRIFDFLDAHPDLEFPGIRAEIMTCMAGFLRALGTSRKVIPHDILDDFRRRAEEYIDHRGSGLVGL